MAKGFRGKDLLQRLSMPLGIAAVLALLIVFFAGPPADRKNSPTPPPATCDAGKKTAPGPGAAEAEGPPLSRGADLRKNDPADKKTSHAGQLARKNSAHLGASAGRRLPAEDTGLSAEESPAGSQGAVYTEAQLRELDPETRALVEEEMRQIEELQPEDELEFDQEDLENVLAEEAAARTEEHRLYPEGRMYTDAQLADLDAETIKLVEEETLQALEAAKAK